MTGLLPLQDTEDDSCLHLSKTESIIASVACGAFAFLSGLFSIIAISLLRVRKFSILFSVMNIMIFVSLGFLIGFKKVLGSLFQKKRALATGIMIIGMLITLFFALFYRFFIGVILGIIIEFLAFVYFLLSYIPMGEAIFHKLIM